MKKITIFTALLVLIFLAGCAKNTGPKLPETNEPSSSGLKICPDEWIDNQMPGDKSEEKTSQYYIVAGERREMNEFDADWVQDNCNLEKQVVW